MGPIASKAARSGIATVAVFLLFVAVGVTLLDAPMEWRLRALQRSFTSAPMLLAALIGWIAFFGWLWLDGRKPQQPSHSRLVNAGLALLTTLLISVGVVVLYETTTRLFNAYWYLGSFPWRYWLRLFEGALFAVAIVRIALPLLPRFDRMSPRSV